MSLRLSLALGISLFVVIGCRRASPPTGDRQPESLSVLIEQLASKTPPLYTNLHDDIPQEIELKAMFGRYCNPEVDHAIEKLKEMGPPIYSELIKHLDDKRYSFSEISAAWLNHTVRDALIVVLSDENYMHSGYKWRAVVSGSGSYLSFNDYLDARGPKQWAAWASDKTRLAIQYDFIDWCVAEEEKRGFTDAKQREQILDNYRSARERVNTESSSEGR